MKRIVRLTEQDLTGLLKGIVNLAVGNLDNSNKKETTSNDDSKETTDNNDSKKNEKDVKELTDKVTNDKEYSIIKSDTYKGKNVHVLFGGSHTSDYSKIKNYVKYL